MCTSAHTTVISQLQPKAVDAFVATSPAARYLVWTTFPYHKIQSYVILTYP